jgi:microcystin-dependent protein
VREANRKLTVAQLRTKVHTLTVAASRATTTTQRRALKRARQRAIQDLAARLNGA